MWKWGRFVKTFWIESKLVQLELCLQCHFWHIHLKLTWCCHLYVTCDICWEHWMRRSRSRDRGLLTVLWTLGPGWSDRAGVYRLYRCTLTVHVFTAHCGLGGAVWAPQLSKLWSAPTRSLPATITRARSKYPSNRFFLFLMKIFFSFYFENILLVFREDAFISNALCMSRHANKLVFCSHILCKTQGGSDVCM